MWYTRRKAAWISSSGIRPEGQLSSAFDSEVFTDLVERITAEGDGHLRFRLKNGLELIETTERSVRTSGLAL